MAYGTVEMVTVDAYKGLRAGGVALAIIATVGMVVILALNTAGAAHIPSGWIALAATGMMVSPVLFLGGKILCKLDDLLERVSGVRALATQRRTPRSAEFDGPTHRAEEPRHLADGTSWMPTDAAWLDDVAGAMEIGREIERRRPTED